MTTKFMLSGLASLALAAASQAAVKYIGTPGGTASSIVDLAVPSVDGVVYTEATFEATFGGDYTDAASAVNGVPTWQLTTADQYVLEDIVAITNGNLIIDAGVVVRGQPRSSSGVFDAGALLITAGSKLIAAGEATNSIVFTTASTSGAGFGDRASGASPVFWDQPGVLAPKSAETAGLWGGVLILGKAPTNADRDGGMTGASVGVNAVGVAGKGTVDQVIFGYGYGASKNTFDGHYTDGTTFSGLTTTAATDDRPAIEGIPGTSTIALAGLDRYGGFDADDNSGIVKYASIRHGGSNLALNSEVNGLTLGGVGRGTTISYVEVYGNTDDGFEFFGGTVNADHLVVIGVQDDGLDLDTGYIGTIQFALVVGGSATDKLLEWDGSYEVETVNGFANTSPVSFSHTPVANYSLYNATLIGNPTGTTSAHNSTINIRSESAGRLVNSLYANPRTTNYIDVDNTDSAKVGTPAPNRNTTNNFAKGLAEFVGVSCYKSGVAGVAAWVAGGGDDATVETALGATARGNKFDSGTDSFPGLGTLPTTGLTGGQNITVIPNSSSAHSGALDAVLDDGTFSANASITFVTYRGAFEPDTNEKWTANWTAAAKASVIVP